jgi:hypothetical protein
MAVAIDCEGGCTAVGASLDSSLHDTAKYVMIITMPKTASFLIADFKFCNYPWQRCWQDNCKFHLD